MKKPAFTLLEMIIAITVFTIFIGFAISTYLTFHRADQEALAMRSLMLEAQGTMDLLVSSIKENTIDYEFYADGSSIGDGVFSGFQSNFFTNFSSGESHVLNDATLVLLSPDGMTRTVYIWDEDTEILYIYTTETDEEGNLTTSEPTPLHSDTTHVTYMNFRIFPDENPYALMAADEAEDSQYYQPTVQIEVTFAMPGRIQEEVTVDFQTSVTSRFYQ